MTKNWMIYGANGYTGKPIARETVRPGSNPILAGRSLGKIEALARELGLNARGFMLNDACAPAKRVAGELATRLPGSSGITISNS